MLGRSGTAADYLICDATTEVFPLPSSTDNVPLVDCASWFVNPFTALSILDTARTKHQSTVLIQTAAASQLGQMLIQLAPTQGMTLVNIVRSKEQWKYLKKDLGATHVICTDDDDWKSQLKAVVHALNIHVAFDAVAGDMTGALLTCMPSRSIVYVYGCLASNPSVEGIDPIDMIYRRKRVLGFHMAKDWLSPTSRRGFTFGSKGNKLFDKVASRINANLQIVGPGLAPGGWAASHLVDCSMENVHETFCGLWTSGFTGKKLRIVLK
jgi:NADPH:quinone reductase-like Zn-dependent oxidoreductase